MIQAATVPAELVVRSEISLSTSAPRAATIGRTISFLGGRFDVNFSDRGTGMSRARGVGVVVYHQ